MLRFSPRRTILALVALAVVATTAAAQSKVPERLSDAEFWKLMTDYSEPWGYFRSENFVSNETSLQWVIPELQKTVKPGTVYLGVAPDQNFTYIINLKPSIAFMVDIRHQNAMQHLLFKALVETSANRAEFLSKLFSTPPITGVSDTATVLQLFEAQSKLQADSALYRRNLAMVKERLMKGHGFALSDSEQVSLDCVYGAFFNAGPRITYNYSSSCRNPGPGFRGPVYPGGGNFGRGGMGMPTYLEMAAETDGTINNRSYMGSEANFRILKDYEQRNLIVPLTGNFAGDKALKTVGQWVRDHGTTIGAFYTSNVEQYLFQQDDEAARFYRNVATLPLDAGSTFIRSYSMGSMYGAPGGVQFKPQSGRSLQLVSSIQEQLKAFDAGNLLAYISVIQLSHQ